VKSIIHQIVNQAKSNLNSHAIEGEDLIVTYNELLKVSYAYANTIKVTDSWIGVDVALGWKAYPAILACWLTGNGYVPLNFDFPKSRMDEIKQQVNWKVLIDESTLLGNEEEIEILNGEKAYLLFTSGTTGKPKGVPIGQENLKAFSNHYLQHSKIDFKSSDKFLQSYELTFDVSVFCYLMPFFIGGTLVLPDQTNSKQLGLFKAIQDYGVTVTSFVPSVIRLTKDFLPRVQFPKLRYSFFSGEALMGDWAKGWMKSVPNAMVYNCYGPTETVIVCTEELLNDLDEVYFQNGLPLPLGEKFENIDFKILKGEIIYTGKQTFKGYLNQETIKEFSSGDLAHYDENGKLIFDGRKDNQVQWNGYRIELEEIDRVLSSKIDGWVKSLFLKITQELVIFSSLSESEIKLLIQESFPDYYKPSRIIQLDELPLNSNGKMDFNQLKKVASK